MGLLSFLKIGASPKVDYREMIKNGAIVVDVRTVQEFNSGHVKGSKNIPLHTLNSKKKAFKGKEVILVCRSGGRASQAKQMLTNSGITAYNAGAWQNLN
jgi:phage shock protein E